MTCYSFREGDSPVLVSVPHDGRMLPADIANRMTAAGLAMQDTDWHVAQLYEFAIECGLNVLVADYSRYVVDLNRSSEDEVLYHGRFSTGLCPLQTFTGEDIYQPDQAPNEREVQERIAEYWQPYHTRIRAELERIKTKYGYALLWDAHSIPGEVPLLFDGALPDLNIGTNDGASCLPEIEAAVAAVAEGSARSSVSNGRFRGGFITRHYGVPAERVCAIQLELAQRCYMDEQSLRYADDRATPLAAVIQDMIDAYTHAASKVIGR